MKSRAGSNLRPSAGLKITASPEKMRLQHGAGTRSTSLKKRTNLSNYLKDKGKQAYTDHEEQKQGATPNGYSSQAIRQQNSAFSVSGSSSVSSLVSNAGKAPKKNQGNQEGTKLAHYKAQIAERQK